MDAAAFVEVVRNANTERAIPEWAAMVRSSEVKAAGGFAGGGFVSC
jgi:hypothetical protein